MVSRLRSEEAEMTTDMKSMTVEELREEVRTSSFGRLAAFDELARRLEEAQQKIVAQQAALKTYGQHLEDCLWATELPTGRGYFGCSCGFDTLEFTLPDDALAAHDAELTAKAKGDKA